MSKCKTSRLEHGMVLLRHEMATINCNRDELHLEQKTQMKISPGEASLHPEDSVRKLTKRLQDRDMYIAFLEEQIRLTRSKYELKVSDVKIGADLLEQELKNVRHQLHEISSKANDLDQLQHQTEILQSKLNRRNAIIAQYEAQHTEIMAIINQLHSTRKSKSKNRLHRRNIATQTHLPQVECVSDGTDVHSEVEPKQEQLKKPVQNFACLTTALKRKFELKIEA